MFDVFKSHAVNSIHPVGNLSPNRMKQPDYHPFPKDPKHYTRFYLINTRTIVNIQNDYLHLY